MLQREAARRATQQYCPATQRDGSWKGTTFRCILLPDRRDWQMALLSIRPNLLHLIYRNALLGLNKWHQVECIILQAMGTCRIIDTLPRKAIRLKLGQS